MDITGGFNIGGAVGGMLGSRREAKGYDKAGDHMAELGPLAYDAREMADPWGSGGYRDRSASYLSQLLTGEADFRADPGYKFVFDEAMRATSRQGAAMGYGTNAQHSGNIGAALQDRAAGLASTEYSKIIDRLMELSGATSQNAVAGAQIFGDMQTASKTGQADAAIGKYAALGRADAAGGEAVHNIVGVVGSNIGGGMFSDRRLKTKVRRIGKDGPVNRYKWKWNKTAKDMFGLSGTSEGYMAQEVRRLLPEAVIYVKGFLALDYDYINRKLEAM